MAHGARRTALLVAALVAVVHGKRTTVRQHRAALPSRRALTAAAFVAAGALGAAEEAFEEEEVLQEAVQERITPPGTFAFYDTDKDGKITKEEFMGATAAALEHHMTTTHTSKERDLVMQMYTDVFAAADIDGNGALGQAELEYSRYLEDLAAKKDVLKSKTPAELLGQDYAKRLVEEHDKNGDGKIDKLEWLQSMRKTGREDFRWEGFLGDQDLARWLEELYAKADMDGDGFLGPGECHYTAFVANEAFRHGDFDRWGLANCLLADMDGDGDEMLSRQEVDDMVRAHRSNIGEPPEGATPVEGEEPREKVIYEIVQERFDEIDADGDGALGRKELLSIATRFLSGEFA